MSNYATRVAVDTPVAHWRLGEQAGASAFNSVDVTSHTGTYSAATLRQQSTGLANDIDTAAAFTGGATSRAAVPFSAALNPTGSFSIEAWVNPDVADGQFRSVLTSRVGTTGQQKGFILYAGSDNNWQFWNGTGTGWDISTGTAVEAGEWTHLVGTYDSGTLTKSFYIDGQLVDEVLGVAYTANNANDFFIGAGGDLGDAFFFDGLIDEVAVYDFALNETTVQDHFQTGLTGEFVQTAAVPEPASIAVWSIIGLALAGYGWRRARRT